MQVVREMPRKQLAFDVSRVRKDFPILKTKVRGKSLVYLDNAATTQKPHHVISMLETYYSEINSNVHRGIHYLSEKATQEYEAARVKCQNFINAKEPQEIIFTRGATESINLVAQAYGRKNIKKGDEILISHMEHHSNIVPWQILCEQTGANLKVIPISDEGELIYEKFLKLLSKKTKLLAITHMSNALGTINPIKEMVKDAHAKKAIVLVDGAQAAAHMKINVQDLDCDFYTFSGHKVYGPTGIGVLYGKEKILEAMPPYQGGGEMISSVTFEKTTYNVIPGKFEAGTPNIAGAIGLGRALDYVNSIGMQHIIKHEKELLVYATEELQKIPQLRIIGTAAYKAGVVSFVLDDIHPHDIGTIVDQEGVAIRTGHHCAQPVMQRFKVPATARASFGLYNTKEEIDALVKALYKVREVFK